MMNNPSGAVSLAKMVAKQTPPPVDINTMADLFLQVRVFTRQPALSANLQHHERAGTHIYQGQTPLLLCCTALLPLQFSPTPLSPHPLLAHGEFP
jgi:hypothetical protein